MLWQISNRFDPRAKRLADRHYNRQTPESDQFMPPGRTLVLYMHADSGQAVWGSSWKYAEYTDHDWDEAWTNTLFRNETDVMSSLLIQQAVAATRWKWDVPPMGMITFVDGAEVGDGKPGYCYQCAGFSHVGYTQSGKHVWQLRPEEMPAPECPQGQTQRLSFA